MPTANAIIHATAGKDKEVRNVIAFINPQANTVKVKKPRCHMLRICFKITPNASGGMIVECKNHTKHGISN
jgi:hypothetical protein